MDMSSTVVVFTVDPVELEDNGTVVQCVDKIAGLASENISIFVGEGI